jgi:ribosome-associated heat shock protein Hsp15
MVEEGKIRLNRMIVNRPAHKLAPGDVLTFPLGNRIRVVRIAALALRRGPAEQARGLYQDLSPSIPGDARANA